MPVGIWRKEQQLHSKSIKKALRDKVIGRQPEPSAKAWFDKHVVVMNVTTENKNGKR